MIEAGGKDKLKQIVLKEYKTYSGLVLEDFFRDAMKESGQYTRIGYWHDRKGENEIDIIAEDELSKTLSFVEVKRQEPNIDHAILRSKASLILLSACRRLKRVRSELRDRVNLQFGSKRIQKITKRQPNEQREQKPNLFGLCRVASEEEVLNPQLIILLTVGIYRTHL